MNKWQKLLVVLSLFALPLLISACATAPAQAPVKMQAAPVAQKGDTVYLFHGGSKIAKQEFCPETVVPVYRYEGRYSTVGSTAVQRREVAKVRITKDLGGYYAEGVVVEGTVTSGDVAVQADSGCLIRVPGAEDK
jgi:hypothetical protein